MILMAMCNKQGSHFVLIFQQISNVRNNEINPWETLVRKLRSAINDDYVVLILNDIHVLPNLAYAA
ncbi:hypothetical protein D3C81_1991350 [compost metagenome]